MDMDRRTQTGLGIALIAILFACCVISETHSNQKTKRESFVFNIMGTVASFTFEEPDTNLFQKDCNAARKQFEQILNVANLYDRKSELVRLNEQAYEKEFICSDLLWKMILEAEKAYYFSDGAFDITVKPLMDVWGFYRKKGKIPSGEEVKAALKKVGFTFIAMILRFAVSSVTLIRLISIIVAVSTIRTNN